jgi:hypothetical protein
MRLVNTPCFAPKATRIHDRSEIEYATSSSTGSDGPPTRLELSEASRLNASTRLSYLAHGIGRP